MNEFSVELAAERIVDRRTRELFAEVLSSYTVGNKRSAMVMLWTVIVCDIVYKLQELRDADGDEIAKQILEEVHAKQSANAESPAWELFLLEETSKRTMLIDNAEKIQVEQIQRLRHLSAHPVLGAADMLYQPNRETVRACMRNALEAVLLKPPVFSKRVADVLLDDLERRRDTMPDTVALAKYIEARYTPPGTPSAVEDAMFKQLWIVSFRASDVRADANRGVNVRALEILHRRRPDATVNHVQAHAAAYSRVGDGERLMALMRFLARNPRLFRPLTPAATQPLSQLADSNVDADAYAWFLRNEFSEHLQRISDRLRGASGAFQIQTPRLSMAAWRDLVGIGREAGRLQETLKIGIAQYTASRSYDSADARFSQYIAPFVQEFTAESIAMLLDGIEGNQETWGRGRARTDHVSVHDVATQVLPAGFDGKKYPKFMSSLP